MSSNYQIDLRVLKKLRGFRASESGEPNLVEEVVYSTPLFSKFVAFTLSILLLVLPVARAHAEGEEGVPEDAPISETTLSSETTIPETEAIVPEEQIIEGTISEEQAAESIPSETETVSESTEAVQDVPETVLDTTEDPVSEEEFVPAEEPGTPAEEVANETVVETEEGDEEVTEESAEEAVGETLSGAGAQSETTGSEEENIPSDLAESEPEPEPEPETPYTSVTANDSMVSFSKEECTIVSEEEFYCTKKRAENASAPGEGVKNNDTVASRVDVEGDLEIFFVEDGVARQITSNAWDDLAPVYDETSRRIVWHALVNDRYQIFFHDVGTNATLQVTDTTFNNTNPDVHGDVIVWQAWEDDNWEIVTARVSGSPYSFEIERVSWDARPDMFPHVYDAFITWQANTDSGWKSYGYDLGLKETRYMGEGTNGDVTSARLVFLVERRNENGDIERVGYELESGEEIPLGSVPEKPALPLPSAPLDDQTSGIPETAPTTAKTPRTDGGEDDTDADSGDEPFEPDTFVE